METLSAALISAFQSMRSDVCSVGHQVCGVDTFSSSLLPCSICLNSLLSSVPRSVTQSTSLNSLKIESHKSDHWAIVFKNLSNNESDPAVTSYFLAPRLLCPCHGQDLDWLAGFQAATQSSSGWADFFFKFHHPSFSIIKIKLIGSTENLRDPPRAVLGFVGETLSRNKRAADFGPVGSSQFCSLLGFGVFLGHNVPCVSTKKVHS